MKLSDDDVLTQLENVHDALVEVENWKSPEAKLTDRFERLILISFAKSLDGIWEQLHRIKETLEGK